jgi:hypothetical protein
VNRAGERITYSGWLQKNGGGKPTSTPKDTTKGGGKKGGKQ